MGNSTNLCIVCKTRPTYTDHYLTKYCVECHRVVNRTKQQVRSNNLRAKKTGIVGQVSLTEWIALCLFFDCRCLHCKKMFRIYQLTIDHIQPLSKNGVNRISNVQPLCLSCNTSKNDGTDDYRDIPVIGCIPE